MEDGEGGHWKALSRGVTYPVEIPQRAGWSTDLSKAEAELKH